MNSGSSFLLTVNILSSSKVTPKEYFFVIWSSYLTWMSFTVTWMLSIILTIILEKYPCSSSSFFDFSLFFAKSLITASQYCSIYFFLASTIFVFLQTHSASGIYVISNYSPSTTTSILLEAKLDHGMFILRQPKRLYLRLKGRLSNLMIYFLSLTFLMTTSPDHRPILRFSELKSSTYSPRILFRIRSTRA